MVAKGEKTTSRTNPTASDLAQVHNAFEERFSILESLPGSVIVVRDDHVVVFMNSSIQSELGNLVGKKCYETDLASEDVCRNCPISGKRLPSDFPFKRLARFKDGRLIEITTSRVVDDVTGSVYYIAMEREITEEVERDRHLLRLRASIEQMTEAVCVFDSDGKIVYANRAFLNLTGTDSSHAADTLLTELNSVAHPGRTLRSLIEENKDNDWEGEATAVRKDGTRYYVRVETKPVRGFDGQMMGAVAIFRDITKEQTEKAEFEKYKSQLERKMEARTNELAKRVSQLTTINKISRVVTSILDPDELVREFVKLISTGFGYEHVLVMMMDKERNDLYFKAGHGPLISNVEPNYRQKLKDGIIGHAAYFAETLVSGDVERDPRYIKLHMENTKSEMAVPIMFRGEVLGVLDIESDRKDAFTKNDVTILEMLSDMLATALTNARTYTESKEREQALTVLDRISKQVSYRLEPSVILDQVAKDAVQLLKAEKALVGLRNEAQDSLRWVASCNVNKDIIQSLTFTSYKGVTGRAFKRLRTEVVNDYASDPDAVARDKEIFDIRSMVAAPMLSEGKAIGVINVYNKTENRRFTRSDALILSSLADHAAIALENANLLASLNQRVRSQLALLETALSMQRQIESKSIYEYVADKVREVMHYDGITFYKVDHEKGLLVPMVARGPYSKEILEDVGQIGVGITGYVAKTGAAELVNDTTKDPRVAQIPGTPELKEAIMAIPLKGREKVLGVLAIYRDDGRTFSADDFEIAQLFASQASVAVENSELFRASEMLLQEATKKMQQMSKVLELTTSVMYMDDLDTLLQRVTDAVTTVFGFRRASVSLLDVTKNVFINRALSGYPDWVSSGAPISVESALEDMKDEYRVGQNTYYSKYEQQSYGIEAFDFLAHPELADKPRAAPDAWHERDILMVALKDRTGKLIGYLLVDEPVDMKVPKKEQIEVLEILGGIASIAVENARLYERQVFAVNEIALLNDLMTHDINNFNQGIMGYLELMLQDKRLDDTHRHYAEKALVQVRNNARLIDNIRKLSKVRAMSEKDFRPLDIQPLVAEAIESVTKAMADRHILVASAIPARTCYVLGNQFLGDLFVNIISNAAKFDTSKRPRIDITVQEQNLPHGDYWLVSIADRGRGIPDDRKKSVFERFATGVTGIKGFGLGLSIVSTIVEKVGGRIWVEDRIPGDFTKGAVFKVLLPKVAPPADHGSTPAEKTPKTTEPAVTSSS